MRRWISLAVAVAMMIPSVASIAEAAVATWLSPAAGQVLGGGKVEVAIGFNTQSKLRVTMLELYIDGQFYSRKILRESATRGVCSLWWDTTGYEQGSHNLVVKVYADDQMISKVYGTGTIGGAAGNGMLDVRPPVVTFANIRSGDVLKGTTTIKLNASDDSGQAPMVSLLVDDTLKLLKNTPPYNYDLDTTTYKDGDHQLKTYAYDAAGNKSDPSVVKVVFNNGTDRPVVTTMTVNHTPERSRADATVSSTIPPALTYARPSIRKSSAARSESRTIDSESLAEPSAVVESRQASASEKHAPAISAKLFDITPDSPRAEVRKSGAKPIISASARLSEPDAPVVMSDARTSSPRSMSASRLPETRLSARSTQIAGAVAEPSNETRMALVPASKAAEIRSELPAPKQSELTRMAMAPRTSLRGASRSDIANGAATVPDEVRDEPVASSAKNLTLSKHLGSLRGVRAERTAERAGALAVPANPTSHKISVSTLKRVQVALAPDMRNCSSAAHTASSIACPPPIPRSSKARIEKVAVPASGKIKARRLFEELGGVLFWDPSTHTVTACVGNMVLEMQIGSRIARVNGHEMELTMAPYLAHGRTIIDARTYIQACNMLSHMQTVGSAKVN